MTPTTLTVRPSTAPATGRWVAATLAVFCGLYLGALHPWLMSWGATAAESGAALPGDAPGTRYFTRGITIHAPAAAVWPWIVQIGQDRAGFYSNSWLENLSGADIHNADAIHPEWQRRSVGDEVRLARADLLRGRLARVSRTEITLLEPGRAIGDIPGRFVLQPQGGDATRLLFRESLASQGPVLTRWLVWDPMHFVMVQRMLRGIKERAEGRPLVPPALRAAAVTGWVLSAAVVFAYLFTRRRGNAWLVLALLPTLAPYAIGDDWTAALAGFLAAGTVIAGALLFGRAWWPLCALLAAGVLLTLLVAPDPFTTFGLVFDVGLLALAAVRRFGRAAATPRASSAP